MTPSCAIDRQQKNQSFVLIINYDMSCQLNTHCIKYCYTMHVICKKNAHTFK